MGIARSSYSFSDSPMEKSQISWMPNRVLQVEIFVMFAMFVDFEGLRGIERDILILEICI